MALKFPLIPPFPPFPPSRFVCECTLHDANATNVWKFQTYFNQLYVNGDLLVFSNHRKFLFALSLLIG
jgi:hypothetical protein